MKLFFRALALSVWLLLATTSTAPAGQADFLFGSLGNADSFIYRYQKTLLTEAFRRNGWTLRIEYYPRADRLMEDMRSGRLDGEAMRVTDFTAGGDHPEYVKVDMPTLTIEWNAYALSPFAVTDWKSLGPLGAQVGYRRGNHTSRLRLEAVLPPERVTAYSTRTELLDALKRREVDIAVISNQFYVQRQLTLERYRSSRIRRLAVLDKKDVCPYFAQRHADLAPVIAGTLKNMKREGVFDDYLKRLMLK